MSCLCVRIGFERLLLLLLLGVLHFVNASNTVQDVFVELFGKAAKDENTRKALVTHLDTLLNLGARQPGEKLLHIPEYADTKARQIGTNHVQSLSADKVGQWADLVASVVPGLDETKSFAMVRRLIVAALFKYWLNNGQQIPDDVAPKVQDVLVKLYDKHRTGAAHKGTMEYLHVSKSGGTTWCHIAELNGCTTERYDRAYVCQIKKFDDKVRWLNMTFHMQQVPVYRVPQYVLRRFSRFGTFRQSPEVASCVGRRRLVSLRNYSYYSNEYTVHGGHKSVENAHMCGDLFNAIVLRDPLKRLVSHMKFVMWTMSGDRGYNDTILFNRMYGNRTSSFWQSLGPAIVDNYFIRSLLGEKAFHVPVGAVSREMLSLAEHVLAQFDLVMVLEQEMEVRNLILWYGIGWRHTMEEVHDKNSQEREAAFNTSSYIPPDLDRLFAAQTLDLELYDFAKTLAQLDPVVYAVAKRAGVQPLPPGGGQSDADAPCGLLRGRSRDSLLAALGAKQPAAAAAAVTKARAVGAAAGGVRGRGGARHGGGGHGQVGGGSGGPGGGFLRTLQALRTAVGMQHGKMVGRLQTREEKPAE